MGNAFGVEHQILTTYRSPNHTDRRNAARPNMIVLHYTGMETAQSAIERLCDTAAEVSAHYVIDPCGAIYGLVDEERRAWHAGRAQWGAVTDVNSHSIGIEIANPGHHLGYPPFPHPQMSSVERLLVQVMNRWSIPPERVVGHACVAPGRKIDPGEKFDWRRLAQQGLAVWLDPRPDVAGAADPDAFRNAAARIGYAAPDGSDWSTALFAVWQAFAMRFLPGRATLPPDAAGVAHAVRIAQHWPVIDPIPATA